jgi:hypothetical protein
VTLEPRPEYLRRLDRAAEQNRLWGGRERWISHLRLAVFIAGVATGWFAFGTHLLDAVWLVPPILLFAALMLVHDRVIQRHRRAERQCEFYERGLARLEDRWSGHGERGEEFRDPRHPYADDLDLFGEGSLFELLCTARTPAGQRALAGWLAAPANTREIRERQAAVQELRERLDLREDLALLGEEVRSQLDPRAMLEWGAAPAELVSLRLRLAAAALAGLTLATLTSWILVGTGPLPFAFGLAAQGLFAWRLRARVLPVIRKVSRPTRDLRLLRGLLERLEREPATAPRLLALRAALETRGLPPSRRIAQLQRLVDLLDARQNQFFAPIGALLIWGTQVSLAVEHWRCEFGRALGRWLEAAGEMEALAALAGYAFEHPEDPFPEIAEEGPCFEGRALGHPLLPRERCVRNDLRLDGELQALVVSGSNMSGKSTLLRTAGTNALLALAGAPVRAASLRVSPLAVGASIRVSDSLQEGTSRFYAEIKRLHRIVKLCEGELPVLFLLDEILHGTNSHDRRIGAAAVVRELLGRGAMGLVTTHDLALAQIADELAPRIDNVHFEDHLEEGRIEFDYRLRPGVVRKSNALELMRAVGLEV